MVPPVSKLPLHASHVALPKYILGTERLHVCCIRVINLCHRVPTQLQLNKYYYYYIIIIIIIIIIRRRMISFLPRLLFLNRMSHWCPFYRRSSGPPSRSEGFGNSAMIYRSISPHETAGVKIMFKTDVQKCGVRYGLDVAHLK